MGGMQYKITKQIPPLLPPGARTSQINRVFNAALGEFLDQQGGATYDKLYKKYIGIAPRFRPGSSDCDPWIEPADFDGAPYVYEEKGRRTGLDFELGEAIAGLIARKYAVPLVARWVAVTPAGDDQADKLASLFAGLGEDDYDLALSGQMMLPEQYLGGLPIEWTAPTSLLFTAINWTGRDAGKLDVRKMKALHSGDLPEFQAFAIEESKRRKLELRMFSVVNPGPSPAAAQSLVYSVNQGGGRSVWDAGDVAASDTVMYTASDHFCIGDSLASGAQAKDKRFKGIYLNVPATQELWPIAGFTASTTVSTENDVAVYAEHSDSKKPMTVDDSLPPLQAGWNVRVFNRTEVKRGRNIHLEQGTGVVSLGVGLYHITASSLVTYDDLAAEGRVTTDAEPFAGYSRLRSAALPGCTNEEAIAIGTMSTANMIPSLIDCWLEVKDERMQLVLEHQVGNVVDHIYLQGIWAHSSWHVFARIAIEKVAP
jgi:hypothetical protein